MSNYTAQDLETLRRQARQIEQVLAARQAAAEKNHADRQAALAARREQELREAYISQQQALAQLPDQLKRAGISGGPAESSLVQLNRGYGSRRADIGSRYAQEYGELLQQKAAEDAQIAEAAAQDRIDYLGAESTLRAQAAEQAAAQAQQQAQQQWSKQLAALQSQLTALQSAGRQTAAAAPAAQTAAGGKTTVVRDRDTDHRKGLVGHINVIR